MGILKPTTKKRLYQDVVDIALSKGGKCLSEKYIDAKTPLIFECSKGHRWETKPNAVIRGSWCGKCFIEKNTKNRRTDIAVYQKLAKEKGGEYLETSFVRCNHLSRWQCECGHQFKRTASQVKNGRWCPKCKGERKYRKSENEIRGIINSILDKHQGECLTDKITKTKLTWKCKRGHEWIATKDDANLYWCSKCKVLDSIIRKNNHLLTAALKIKGFELISNEITDLNKDVKIKSPKGIVIEKNGYEIVKGKWTI